MGSIKQRIEDFFEKTGHLLYRHKIKTLTAVFIFIGFMCLQITKVNVDTSPDAMLHENDPARIQYDNFLEQFGNDEIIVIAVKSKDIFNPDFLKKLKAFHHELENEVPHVRKISSLINARKTWGEGDEIHVDDLLKKWPEKKEDFDSLRKEVLGNPLYLNNYISENGQLTALLIETDTSATKSSPEHIQSDNFDGEEEISFEGKQNRPEKEDPDLIQSVRNVMARYHGPDFHIAISGAPVVLDVFNHAIMKDMVISVTIGNAFAIIILGILFVRISGILIPLSVIISSIFSTFGLIALAQAPITMTSNAIAPFLLAVSVGDSVHVLTIFYQHFSEGHSKEDSIAYALGHSGLAIFLTTLTTAGGLLSFSFAELSSISDMGLYAAAGVVMAFFFTITMLPPLLAFCPIKQKIRKNKSSDFINRILQSFADFSCTHPRKIAVIGLIILVIAVYFIFKIEFSHYTPGLFPENTAIRKDMLLIDTELKGISALEVIVDTGEKGGIYDPEILNSIEELSRDMEEAEYPGISVGKVFSINNILKETNQALHGNDSDHYAIPEDRKMIAQEFFLFEISGSDDLEKLVDRQFSKTRITIKTGYVDGVIYKSFIDRIKTKFQENFQDKADIILTGVMALEARAITATLHSMAKSYVIAFIVITLMMVLLVGNIQTGMLSMIPNLFPIIFTIGMMGLAKVPLDMTTIMMGSIALGIVVDDTVHFIHIFHKYYDKTADVVGSIKQTFLTTGRALLTTSLILSSAFLSPIFFLTMKNVFRFGILMGMTIIVALLADFMLAPVLLIYVNRKQNHISIKTATAMARPFHSGS